MHTVNQQYGQGLDPVVLSLTSPSLPRGVRLDLRIPDELKGLSWEDQRALAARFFLEQTPYEAALREIAQFQENGREEEEKDIFEGVQQVLSEDLDYLRVLSPLAKPGAGPPVHIDDAAGTIRVVCDRMVQRIKEVRGSLLSAESEPKLEGSDVTEHEKDLMRRLEEVEGDARRKTAFANDFYQRWQETLQTLQRKDSDARLRREHTQLKDEHARLQEKHEELKKVSQHLEGRVSILSELVDKLEDEMEARLAQLRSQRDAALAELEKQTGSKIPRSARVSAGIPRKKRQSQPTIVVDGPLTPFNLLHPAHVGWLGEIARRTNATLDKLVDMTKDGTFTQWLAEQVSLGTLGEYQRRHAVAIQRKIAARLAMEKQDETSFMVPDQA